MDNFSGEGLLMTDPVAWNCRQKTRPVDNIPTVIRRIEEASVNRLFQELWHNLWNVLSCPAIRSRHTYRIPGMH